MPANYNAEAEFNRLLDLGTDPAEAYEAATGKKPRSGGQPSDKPQAPLAASALETISSAREPLTAQDAIISGLTSPFNMGDEIKAGVAAGLGTFMPNPKNLSLRERYLEAKGGLKEHSERLDDDDGYPWLHGGAQAASSLAFTAPVVAGTGALGLLAGAAGYGMLDGFGMSEADLTSGDSDEYWRVQKDMLQGGALGVAGAALGAGASKAGSAAWRGGKNLLNKIRPTKNEAKLARKAGEAARSQLDNTSTEAAEQTARQFTKQSDELERLNSQALGEEFMFAPKQKTGLGGVEEVGHLTASRLDQSQRLVDKVVTKLAKNPERLGKPEVVKQATKAVKAHVEGLKTDLRATSKLFQQVDELSQGQPTIDTRNMTDFLKEALGRKDYPASDASALAKRIQTQMDELTQNGGKVTASDLNKLLVDWGEKANYGEEIFDGILKGKSARNFARGLLNAARRDLNTAATVGDDAASQALKQARQVYAQKIEAISKTGTSTVRKMLKLGEGDTAEGIADHLISTSVKPEQVAGVFKILRKSAPAEADDLGAELFRRVLTQAKSGAKGAGEIAKDLGTHRIDPAKARDVLAGNERKVLAMFPTAEGEYAMRQLLGTFQRLSVNPVEESTQAAIMSLVGRAAEVAAYGAGGFPAKAATTAITKATKNPALIIQSPEAIRAYNEGLNAIIENKPVGRKLAMTLMELFTNANNPEEPAEPSENAGVMVE